LIAQQTQPLAVLYLAALGFGLFNLGYATALGLAYTMAQLTLTAMLVGSLILATMGQGWALAALSLPISLDRRPLLLLGFVTGFPALLGAWLGGLPATPTQTVLLLGIGLGGLLAAGYEVAQAFGRDSRLSAAAG
jgi:hypothetical protein